MRNQMEEICANCDFANSATYKTMPTKVIQILDNTVSDSIENGVLKQDTTAATGSEEDSSDNSDQLGHYVMAITNKAGVMWSWLTRLLKMICKYFVGYKSTALLKTQKQSNYSKSYHRSTHRENYLLCDGM